MTTSSPIQTIPTHVPALRQREAFAAIQEELRALPADDLPRVTVDIREAVMTAIGCVPELVTLAPQLASDLPTMDPLLFTKLERYALALGHAQTQFVAASQPSVPIAQLTDQLKEMVDRFLADATSLAKRALMDGERLNHVAGVKGPKNTASSALLLVELFRMNWAGLTGKTPVTIAELDDAESLANRIEAAIGVRDQGTPGVPDATLARSKVYALFVRTYDEARRAVSHLRWHQGDADDLLPSLHAARGRRSTGSDLRTDAAPDAPASPLTNGSTTGVASSEPAANIPVGLPGSSPFVSG